MKKTFILLLLATFTLFVACTKEQVIPQENVREESVEILHLNGMVIKAIKRTNPYTVENMRKAYSSLTSNETKSGGNEEEYFNPDIDLEANCFYIKIQVDTTTNMEMLDSLGLELFEIPMDYEVIESEEEEEGETCEEIPLMSFYTSVQADFIFPDWLEYEVLAECYIPNDDDFDFITITRSQTESFASMLERQAYIIAGTPYDNERCNIHTKSGYAPQGCFRVETSNGNSEPLKGVKVRCHTFVKYGYTYTDANGYYSFQGTKKWVSSPEYTLIFSNTKGFNVYGNRLVFLPATYSLGTHNRSGFSTTIGTSSQAWKWAVINNASYDYYSTCDISIIPRPCNNLRILVVPGNLNNAAWGAAPMLRRIYAVGTDFQNRIVNALTNSFMMNVSSISLLLFKFILPDIIINCGSYQNSNYQDMYYMMWHELSHSSHFQVAGPSYWYIYATHIFSNGFNYGNKTSTNSDIVDLGESWACAYTSFIHYSRLNTSFKYYDEGHFSSGEPFNSRPITDLMENGILTPSQIIHCMSSNVHSVYELKNKLSTIYNNQSIDIINTFASYSI